MHTTNESYLSSFFKNRVIEVNKNKDSNILCDYDLLH